MRLIDLDPKWVTRSGRVVGVRFTCPIAAGPPHPDGHSMCVLFANPPDGGPPHPDDVTAPGNSKGRRWQRSGETFDTLTLSPSIDATAAEGCAATDHHACAHAHCWHGFIRDGAIA